MIQDAVTMTVSQGGNCAIGNMTATLGICNRQLERLFNRYTGLSQKTFARMIRFAAAR